MGNGGWGGVRAWRKEEGEKEEMREGFAEEREGDA